MKPRIMSEIKESDKRKFDMASVSSFSFFKSIVARDTTDNYINELTLFCCAIGITWPLVAGGYAFWLIPEIPYAAYKTFKRKTPLCTGEELYTYVQHLKNMDDCEFNRFLAKFIKNAHTVPSVHSDACTSNQMLIMDLKDWDPRVSRRETKNREEKIKSIIKYLQNPALSIGKLYKILTDNLREAYEDYQKEIFQPKMI